jgi:hypothetical protein
VRPGSGYTSGVKLKLVHAAGQVEASAANYELDHTIPLALGGHPRSLNNLQIQPWPEAKRKGRIEVKLQCLVCSGQITLPDAQTLTAEEYIVGETRYRDGSVLVLTISPKICFDPLFAIRRLPHGDLEIIEQLANCTNGYGHCHGVRFQTSIAYATKPVIHFEQLTS